MRNVGGNDIIPTTDLMRELWLLDAKLSRARKRLPDDGTLKQYDLALLEYRQCQIKIIERQLKESARLARDNTSSQNDTSYPVYTKIHLIRRTYGTK